ncbi:hypothetical protein SGRIM128S_09614 [Streptomyces griseomycini]
MSSAPTARIALRMFSSATRGSHFLVSYDAAMSTLPSSSPSAPFLNRAVLGSVGSPFIITTLLPSAPAPRALTSARPCSSPTSSLSCETYASTGPSARRS